MDIEYFLESPKGRLLEGHVRKNFPEEYPNILQYPGKKWAEKLYNYLYGCPEHNCVVCGKPTKFRSFVEGYSRTCSLRCGWQYGNKKARETIYKKYGVDNISQLDSIKQKKQQTMIDNYGSLEEAYKLKAQKSSTVYKQRYGSVEAKQRIKEAKSQTMIDNYGSLEEAYNQRNEKSRQTKFERYADEYYNNRSQAARTCTDLYGVDNAFKLPEVFQASLAQRHLNNSYKIIRQKATERAILRNEYVLSSQDNNYTCSCPHPECNQCQEKTFDISIPLYHYRIHSDNELCTILNAPGKHLKGTRPETIVRGILDEIGISYQTNVRDVINPHELDIYIPSKNMAIEINGVFWHSDKFKARRYHINKFTECNKRGIQLLTIWEDQLYRSPEAVKSVILSKLGIYNKRVGARQCYIKEVRANVASQFENEYHLQGSTPSRYKLGLYYKDELVSLMTFGKARTGMSSKDKKDGEYELIRYCCKSGWQVVGGASKLFKHFIQLVHPTAILSFSSNDISNGTLYKSLGFIKVGETVGYWYIDKELNRYHRYTFNKYNIAKRGWAPAGGEWTERSVMDDLGFYRIWDSGQTKWILQIPPETTTN